MPHRWYAGWRIPDVRSIVNQREIGLDTDSYGNALRAALREDPDIILVGEMRDFDTISTAITAAETGHLVLLVRWEHIDNTLNGRCRTDGMQGGEYQMSGPS